MSDTPGSLIRHAALAACLLMFAARAHAQSQDAPPQPGFFTRYDFRLSLDSLNVDDEHFSWDTHFGGDLDIADYKKGRTSIVLDYEAILGSEFRPFDPEQAYYTLEVSSSYRAGPAEVAVVFHHVSRHLSDRPKRFPIAWNVLGARLSRHVSAGGLTVDARMEGGGVVQHSYVDYKWTADADVMVRRAVSPAASVFVHGYGELFGVDGSLAARESQRGGLIEAGVRFDGRAGALELFAGFEKRVDADPVNMLPRHWGMVGFRLLRQ